MSFNPNHIISIDNYEEWFILYMDNELVAEQKKLVEDFVLLHPHLQESLDLLLSTRLPAEEVVFAGKEELLAPVMKLNIVDESLLLFVDNELPAIEQKEVESRIAVDKNLQLQYQLLLKTKLDKNEKILYPIKKELYRYAERSVTVPVWMRVAAAVVLLLLGGYFFVQDYLTDTTAPGNVVVMENPVKAEKLSIPGKSLQEKTNLPQQDASLAATVAAAKTVERNERKGAPAVPVSEIIPEQLASLVLPNETIKTTPAAIQEWDAVRVDVKKSAAQLTTSLNNSMANLRVTSVVAATYNQTEDPEEPAVTGRDNERNHRTPAKGFLRKVSRFIERRTGIGTVNADNELLVGAVSLKLN